MLFEKSLKNSLYEKSLKNSMYSANYKADRSETATYKPDK